MVGSWRRRLRKPRYIIISGIDGSGKTVIIDELQKRLEADGLPVFYVWMRFNHIIIKPVHAFCRLMGLSRRRQTSRGKVWRHEFYRCQPFCSLYIFLTWLDTWLGRVILLRQIRNMQTDVVICDRWVNDILIDLAVDSRRERLLDSKWYARFQSIVPTGTKQFLLVRKVGEIIACRPECHDDPDFAFRLNMYHRLEDMSDTVTIVTNDGTVKQTMDILLAHIGNLDR